MSAQPGDHNPFKVSLTSATYAADRVVFKVSPDLIENRNVNYRAMDGTHMPGNFQVFQNTASRTFNVSNIKFISRTSQEATDNLIALNILRSWALPYFGEGTRKALSTTTEDFTEKGFNKLTTQQIQAGVAPSITTTRPVFGAPPDILHLTAYASGVGGVAESHKNIYKIPVVLQNLSIPYPSDVDYIPTNEKIPFPTIMTLDLQLIESHSPREYRTFDLLAYKTGTLKNF